MGGSKRRWMREEPAHSQNEANKQIRKCRFVVVFLILAHLQTKGGQLDEFKASFPFSAFKT